MYDDPNSAVLAVTLPAWLLAGVVLGVVLSTVIAAVFYVGRRRFEGTASASAGTGYDSDDRRRREVRAYLEAIGEPFVEDREVAGAEVAFYLPERDVALTFDARAYFRIENAPEAAEDGTTAVLLEHELPGANVGSRLPFETPEFGAPTAVAGSAASTGNASRSASRGGRTARGSAVDAACEDRRRIHAAFAALGLPPHASADDVEAAYRRRVKEVHPDQGGDRRQFYRVREAYELASERAD